MTSGPTRVLIDPILTPYFGNCAEIKFPIYPPRQIYADLYSDVSAIVLSHEHLDHFHLESLFKIDRSTPFFVGPLMPACVLDAIIMMGFSPSRCKFNEPIVVGAFSIRLFPPGLDTIFWERRVSQILLTEARTGSTSVSAFIAVDAEVSEDFRDLVKERVFPIPDICLVSNNSQICPSGAFGAQNSIIPTYESRVSPTAGLEILNELVLNTVRILGRPKIIGICGNGYIDVTQLHGPFLFSDHAMMASAASTLLNEVRIWGPLPGEKISYSSESYFIAADPNVKLDVERHTELKQRLQEFVKTPQYVKIKSLTSDYSSQVEAEHALEIVLAELNKIVPVALTSQFGVSMLSTNEYLDGPLNGARFVVTLLGDQIPSRWNLLLDLNRCEFNPGEGSAEELLRKYPFGFECFLCDLEAVFDGRLQIWDLMGTATRSWFLGSKYASPMSFMIAALSEQCRPDLARRVISAEMSRLNSSPV